MRKKLLIFVLATIMMLAVFSLTGCSSLHGIPNGKYVSTDGSSANSTLLRDGVNDYDYYWRIKGDKATWYASGSKSYVGKIMQEDGKLFFYGETWFDILAWRKLGNATKYEVEYDESTKNLTISTSSQNT